MGYFYFLRIAQCQSVGLLTRKCWLESGSVGHPNTPTQYHLLSKDIQQAAMHQGYFCDI